MADVFHLELTRDMVGGAEVAIVPGDPGRVERIAAGFEDPEFLASNREFTSFRGTLDDAGEVVVQLVLSNRQASPLDLAVRPTDFVSFECAAFLSQSTDGVVELLDLRVGKLHGGAQYSGERVA